jgi:ABC-type dipeptide/oligopeptide/nickel transport system permease subunit
MGKTSVGVISLIPVVIVSFYVAIRFHLNIGQAMLLAAALSFIVLGFVFSLGGK